MRDNTTKTQCQSDVRLCVTGGSSVGKSAITVRFLTRRFIGEYQQDVEQKYRGLIDFGPDTIKYDLVDTDRSPGKSFFSTWPTCIAVIYSINDIRSFTTASQLLDDIDTSIRESSDCNVEVPSLALIGNKSDLEHFRHIREEEGQLLANKHGATFWEASASEDYHSTFRPLSSLIIKSFLKSKRSGSTCSSSPTSSGTEEKSLSTVDDDEIQCLLRRYSEPTNNSSRLISAPKLQRDNQAKENDDPLSRNVTAANSSPSRNTIKRRKKFREFKSKSFDKITVRPVSSTAMKPPSSDSPTPLPSLMTNDDVTLPGSNITIEVTDTSTDTNTLKMTRNCRSRSLPKSNTSSFSSSSRLIQRKGKGSYKHNSSRNVTPMGIEKSHSFTDLKSLKYLSVDSLSSGVSSANSELTLASGESGGELNRLGRSSSMNALLSRSQSMRHGSNGRLNVFRSLSRSNSVRHSASAGKLDVVKSESKEKLKSVSTSSVGSFEQNKNSKNRWSRLGKDRHKLHAMYQHHQSDYDKESRDEESSTLNEKIDRKIDAPAYDISSSKSMRRKFTSMFRPRSINVSVER